MAADNQSHVSVKSSKRKVARLNCTNVLLVLLVLIALCVLALRNPYRSVFDADPNNASDTIQAFAYSLAHNKLDEVKSYVSEDKWAFIDTWSTRHQAVSPDCKDLEDSDVGPFWSSSFDDSTQMASITFFLNQECPDSFYMFRISDAKLKRVDSRWQVMDWSEICERATEDEQCY